MSTVTHQNDYFSLDNFVEPHFSRLLSWYKESTELGHSPLRMFAGAVIGNYHKLSDFKKKTSSSHSAGGWNPQIKGWAGPPSLSMCHPSYLILASDGGLQSLACLAWQLTLKLGSVTTWQLHGIFPRCMCFLCPKGQSGHSSHIGLGSTLTLCFNFVAHVKILFLNKVTFRGTEG